MTKTATRQEDEKMESLKSVSIPQLTIKDYIDNQEKCFLCGGKLVYTHQTDFYNLSVKEDCKCPQCGITNNPSHFTLN